MSSIIVKHNLDNKNWSINESGLSHVFTDIFIGFESTDSPIVFRNLSFGVTVLRDGQDFFTTKFPKHNTSYISTDQPFVETIRLELTHNTEYTLSVWCNENETLTDSSYTFTTPEFVLEPYPDYEVS
jgi:hypothetical protein